MHIIQNDSLSTEGLNMKAMSSSRGEPIGPPWGMSTARSKPITVSFSCLYLVEE